CGRSDQPTGPALHWVCEHVQPCIDRRTECLRDHPRTADLIHLKMVTAMETHTKHELDLRGEPVSVPADSLPTQVDEARARSSEYKVAACQQRQPQDQTTL